MTGLEEQFGRHTTMLQEIKGMLIRLQSKDDDNDDKEDDQGFGVQTMLLVCSVFIISLKLLLAQLGSLLVFIHVLWIVLNTFKVWLTCFGCF